MKVKTTHTTAADKASAKAFFDMLMAMYDFSKMKALDAFARNGELTVSTYADVVDTLDCWELGEEHKEALQSIANVRSVTIGCSYGTTDDWLAYTDEKFDLLVIDTPQGLHRSADGKTRIEHFDFLQYCAPNLIADEALIVLYVNKEPYDNRVMGEHGYDTYAEYDFDRWMRERREFYGSENITEGQAISRYIELLKRRGFEVRQVATVPCFSDVPGKDAYAFRLALSVKRISK